MPKSVIALESGLDEKYVEIAHCAGSNCSKSLNIGKKTFPACFYLENKALNKTMKGCVAFDENLPASTAEQFYNNRNSGVEATKTGEYELQICKNSYCNNGEPASHNRCVWVYLVAVTMFFGTFNLA